VQVSRQPQGFAVTGEWHVGYLEDTWRQQQRRFNPDVNPMWSSQVFQLNDSAYRRSNYAVPGTVWPTAAVGMTSHVPQLRGIEGSGVHFWQVTPSGYVQFMWYGPQ
jgi:hypothetical protein